MDPISLIVAALVTGAAAAMNDTAGQAVKDAYSGLKAIVRRKFGRSVEAQAALDQTEQPNPDTSPVADHLRTVGADRDEELVKAAQAVLAEVDPAGAKAGKYNVQISGGKGVVVGDNANVTMTFNDGD